jgi:hypothetical protein
MSQEDFNQLSLKRSIEKVGQLYSVIVNQDGKILDGNHRSAEIVNPEKKVVQTKNRYEELMVRGNAHYRRRVPQEETRQLIIEMANELVKAEIPKSMVAKQLFEDLPYSEGYILSLLPDDFKEKAKVEAGKSAHIVEHTVKTQDMQICEVHGTASSDTDFVTILGKPRRLCGRCRLDYPNNTLRYESHFRHLNGESKTLEERLQPKPEPLYKEKWEHTQGTMQTNDPEAERFFDEEAQALGLHGFRVKPEIPVISVWPDNFHVETKTLFWMDNEELHKGKRADKDEKYREILEGRGFKNEVHTYKGKTTRAKVRAFLEDWKRRAGI